MIEKLELKESIRTFTDMMEEGFIVIDSLGKIQVYNKKAKEIFNVESNHHIYHDKGRIEEGDIVIIADNLLGGDDGNLNYSDLESLGIKDKEIEKGDGLVAIGLYRDRSLKPIYRTIKSQDRKDRLNLKAEFLGQDLEVDIDYKARVINIVANGEAYPIEYIDSFGHMLVLNRMGKVKFYQHPGYTAKGEGIRDLLLGGEYIAKGIGSEKFKVIGKNICEIHESDIIDKFLKVARGASKDILNRAERINGISTLCSILGVNSEDGKVLGAALKVRDISLIEQTITERDRARASLKEAEEALYYRDRLDQAFASFVGTSPEISHVKKMALKASNTNSNVLILGESGTGKSVLAKLIHENSKYRDRPFIHVNCGAIPENLLESELFGYEKGAFTGASASGKKGFFEMADGGSLFLDEIGDISLGLQIKLLQAIQNKSFYPVGATREVRVDVRIITATNKNLEEEMLAGRFREDLYYRINVFPIYIPGLKDRKEDIEELVGLILPKICKTMFLEEKSLSREALESLKSYDWPGNIRELENILERAVNLTDGYIIHSQNIDIKRSKVMEIKTLKEELRDEEERLIRERLDYFNGDAKRARETLGISRSSFYQKIKDYHIKK